MMGSVKDVVLVRTAFDPNSLIDSMVNFYSQSPERQLEARVGYGTDARKRLNGPTCLGNFSMGTSSARASWGMTPPVQSVALRCCVTLAVGMALIIDE